MTKEFSEIIKEGNFENRGHLTTELSDPTTIPLETLPTEEMVKIFSQEDLVPQIAVSNVIPELSKAIEGITYRLSNGGKLFYIGAGTSGRLGVLDASECPPTFCTSPDFVQAIIAGGTISLTSSSEGLEDSHCLSIEDLKSRDFSSKDCLVGITAGGTTPYVSSALKYAFDINALTVAISCVPREQASLVSHIDIRLITGAEVLAGSTRLKAGTATKMALNIISTCVMIKLGKVFNNRMIDLSASNNKLVDRSIRIISDLANINRAQSIDLLSRSEGSVKLALLMAFSNLSNKEAKELLALNQNNLRKSLDSIS